MIVARGVQSEIDRFESGALTTAFRWPSGSVVGLPVSSDIAGTSDQIAVPVGDPEHGTSVAVPSANGLSRMTTEADVTTARIDFGTVRVVKWTSKEGIALEGIATFPAGYQSGRRYPFLVCRTVDPKRTTSWFSMPSRALSPGSAMWCCSRNTAVPRGTAPTSCRRYTSTSAIVHSATSTAQPTLPSHRGGRIRNGCDLRLECRRFHDVWTVTQTNRYRAAIEGAGITDWASFMWTSDVQQWDYDARWPEKDLQAFVQFGRGARRTGRDAALGAARERRISGSNVSGARAV